LLLSPATTDVKTPLACQADHGIVILTIGQLPASRRLKLQALNQLLKLLNLVQKANQIVFSHGGGSLDVRPSRQQNRHSNALAYSAPMHRKLSNRITAANPGATRFLPQTDPIRHGLI
tara:strand:+ start:1170 stop:1523 length:354 start_codon:yes stop_codon:yes gene_type:complete